MDKGQLVIAGLLIISVLLCCETSELQEQSDTCVKVEVNCNNGQNNSETACDPPKKPSNGGYVSESDVNGHMYKRGDTIQYYCHRGHRLIGQAFRTCNGTAKQWEPDEPYCQPEYIGDLMNRLNVFEGNLNAINAKVSAMEQTITSVENNTLEMRDKISEIDNKGLANDNKSADIESRLSSSVAAAKESFSRPISKIREHIMTCSNDTEAIDEVTVFDCVTMQLGVRAGYSVFESKWVIKDYNSKTSAEATYYSSPFYHTVPGYKFRLKGYVTSDTSTYIYLQLLPGEYDDQLTWPVTIKYDSTVLTNDGSEVLHASQPGTCSEKRPTSASLTSCYTFDSNWSVVFRDKKHILNDGSVAFKLYVDNYY